MRLTPTAVVLLPCLALASPSSAQQPAPPQTVTANVAFASEFVSRGLSLSNRKPAFQGGVDWAHACGVYLGTWASSATILSDQGGSNSFEWDLYGGFRHTAGDLGLDLGAIYFYYPGQYPDDWVSPNTLELNVAGTWKVLTLKYSYGLTNQYGFQTPEGGDTKGSSYVDLTATVPLGAGFTLTGHVGHQRIKGYDDASYSDWKLGLAKDLAGFTFTLAWVDTDAKGDPGEPYHNPLGTDLGAGRIFGSVGRSF
jgi:uncharacterized protein (TIGR02001 family)